MAEFKTQARWNKLRKAAQLGDREGSYGDDRSTSTKERFKKFPAVCTEVCGAQRFLRCTLQSIRFHTKKFCGVPVRIDTRRLAVDVHEAIVAFS